MQTLSIATIEFDEKWNYVHYPTGAFVADGPRSTATRERLNGSIYNVAPTLIGVYGLAMDGTLGGQIRREILADGELETVVELPPLGGDDPEDMSEYTDAICEQLRDLGYRQ